MYQLYGNKKKHKNNAILQDNIEKLNQYDFRTAINNIEDFEIYLRIKSDQEAIKYSGFKEAPNRQRFQYYYSRLF